MKMIDKTIGSAGKSFEKLLNEILIPAFDNPFLAKKGDGAVLPPMNGRIVFSTDAHIVSPLFFKGGNIGKLAFCGTVNDVAMMGAVPKYLTMSFIIEEGFELKLLETIVESIAELSKQFKIPVVSGDTKVVEKGKGDGIFITCSGIGEIVNPSVSLLPENIPVGADIILSGSIGEHGVAVMSAHDAYSFD